MAHLLDLAAPLMDSGIDPRSPQGILGSFNRPGCTIGGFFGRFLEGFPKTFCVDVSGPRDCPCGVQGFRDGILCGLGKG
ncbi:hypothetical protein [Solidesulfovibrio carbinoliphilus]|uniref:hypothetical protein n=1 Tax=Solidesulfovibrio carbinoliphilus TaxID=345370 RepID=UPI0005BB36A8|nr:hypothetical protein [Solidesulfovibrio carbinoliphilus]